MKLCGGGARHFEQVNCEPLLSKFIRPLMQLAISMQIYNLPFHPKKRCPQNAWQLGP